MTDTQNIRSRLVANISYMPDDAAAGMLVYLDKDGKPQIIGIAATPPQLIQMLGAATAKIGGAMVPVATPAPATEPTA